MKLSTHLAFRVLGAPLAACFCLTFPLACRPDVPSTLAPSASSLPAVSLTTDAQELHAFAKLYGYVRYFHPSDAAATVDWNAFATEGIKRVVQARDRDVPLALHRLRAAAVSPSNATRERVVFGSGVLEGVGWMSGRGRARDHRLP